MEKRSKVLLWISYVLQCMIALFLMMGVVNNLLKTEVAVSNSQALGYPLSALSPLAIFLLIATLFYLIPRTALLGAVMLTAWYGGAVATHIIHGDNLITLLLPMVFGILSWIAIGLRNQKVKSLIL